MPGGRPTKFTPETIAKLEDAFLMGCSDLEACLYADVSKTALYNYQHAHPEFVDRKEILKQNPIFIARRKLLEDVGEDGKLALEFLKNKRNKEFNTRTENTGADGGPIQTDNKWTVEFVNASPESEPET